MVIHWSHDAVITVKWMYDNLYEAAKEDTARNRETRMNDDIIHLNHIFAALDQIDRYTRGMSESEFLSRTMVQDAVIRQIELIGEAAGCISVEFQNEHPKLQWAGMTDIRKRIIPESFNINFIAVWNMVQDELPLRKQVIKKLL
jgi:uncharacterized protein with HEPN domain